MPSNIFMEKREVKLLIKYTKQVRNNIGQKNVIVVFVCSKHGKIFITSAKKH